MADESEREGPGQAGGGVGPLQTGRGRQPSPDLAAENARLKAELAKYQQAKGPDRGTKIRYVRAGESFSRPAVVLSDGFTARVKGPGGDRLHVHLAYGEPEGKEGLPLTHTFEVDRPWDPLGKPETWHMLDDEAAKATQAP